MSIGSENAQVLENGLKQDIKGEVLPSIHAAAAQVAKDVNAGKTPSLNTGGDMFSVFAEGMKAAKTGPGAGILMTAGADLLSGPRSIDSVFFGGGSSSKRDRKAQQLYSMNDGMGMKKSFSHLKQDIDTRQRLASGRALKNNDPVAAAAAAPKAEKKKHLTKEDVMAGMVPGASGWLKMQEGAAHQADQSPPLSKAAKKLAEGDEQMRGYAQNVDKSMLMESARNLGQDTLKAVVKATVPEATRNNFMAMKHMGLQLPSPTA